MSVFKVVHLTINIWVSVPLTIILTGFNVAQIRLIIHPHWTLPTAEPMYLSYVHRFDIVPQSKHDGRRGPVPDPISGMYVLKRAVRSDQSPMGGIIALSNCRIPSHLVPRFGSKADSRLTSKNSLEYSKEFSLNKYFDKDIFKFFRSACPIV
jgi:hypothetical protein